VKGNPFLTSREPPLSPPSRWCSFSYRKKIISLFLVGRLPLSHPGKTFFSPETVHPSFVPRMGSPFPPPPLASFKPTQRNFFFVVQGPFLFQYADPSKLKPPFSFPKTEPPSFVNDDVKVETPFPFLLACKRTDRTSPGGKEKTTLERTSGRQTLFPFF